MKKFLAICFFSAIIISSIFSCKDTEINNDELVRNKFLGKWPLRTRRIAYFRDGAAAPDSTQITNFSTIDTLIFANDGSLTIGPLSTTYSFDAGSENVTYHTTPPITWKIDSLRISSIILTRAASGTLNGEPRRTVVSETLQK